MCRAVDIFQNSCRPVAIRAVIIFLCKSETAQNTRTADDFLFSTRCQYFWLLLKWCRAVVFLCQPVISCYRNSSSWTSPLPSPTLKCHVWAIFSRDQESWVTCNCIKLGLQNDYFLDFHFTKTEDFRIDLKKFANEIR